MQNNELSELKIIIEKKKTIRSIIF